MSKKTNLGKKYKLSDIWTWASKDLKQIRDNFGDAENGKACALGAIEYYRSNKKTCTPVWGAWKKISYQNAVDKFQDKYGDIAGINDYGGYKNEKGMYKEGRPWSFKKFAEAAKKIGL